MNPPDDEGSPPPARHDDRVANTLQRWRDLHPDLDLTTMAVWASIARLAHLADHWTARNAAEYGLRQGEADVLVALYRSGGGLRHRELRRAMLIGSGTLSPRIDRLEGLGFVRRRPDETDRRGNVVELTDEGRQTVPALVRSLLSIESDILAALPTETVQRLAEDLSALVRVTPVPEVPTSG